MPRERSVKLIRCYDYSSDLDHLAWFGNDIGRDEFIDAVEKMTGKQITDRDNFPCFSHWWIWDESEQAWGDCDDEAPGSCPVTTVKRCDWDWGEPPGAEEAHDATSAICDSSQGLP